MNVLVDTCIWSMALRRSSPQDSVQVRELKELIGEQRVVLIGPVRQEILSGIRERMHFDGLRDKLRSFPDYPVTAQDYEYAAECFNTCRRAGIQGANTDYLLCAVAVRHNIPIFTSDDDFAAFRKHLDFTLYEPRG